MGEFSPILNLVPTADIGWLRTAVTNLIAVCDKGAEIMDEQIAALNEIAEVARPHTLGTKRTNPITREAMIADFKLIVDLATA